eukprot:COSAG02_NODE_597_length_19775_cov_28.914312_5_plen_196_part_00
MHAASAALVRRSSCTRRCKLSCSAIHAPAPTAGAVWRQCRHRSAPAATAAVLDVQPEGTLKVRTNALDLSIATETEHCNSISFDSCANSDPAAPTVRGLKLTADGEHSAELVGRVDAAFQSRMDDGGGVGRYRPLLRGLIPAKYNVDIETKGGNVELGFLEGAATIDTQGGNIQVDKITSAEIHLASAGGDVAAR